MVTRIAAEFDPDRITGDYGVEATIEPEDAAKAIERAREFL